MILLPWPDKALNPNSRTHWAVKAKATKAARGDACWATKAAKVRVDGDGKIDLFILFQPPTKRRHDLDNCLAALKGALDGIADGLGVNDQRFRLHLEMGEPVKNGGVSVFVKALA